MEIVEPLNAIDEATIVCSIENGRLERQTLLMLELLRRWGGPLGRSRVLAVMPRSDRRPPAETIAALESFGVELHDGARWSRSPCCGWHSKVIAARVAERLATTPVIVWIDSDALIFGPLVELGLPFGDDFTARRESTAPAVLGETSPHVEHWKFFCKVVGMRWDDVPWLPADPPEPPQRLMFDAGVYAFRRGLGFAEAYADCTERLSRAGVAFGRGAYWNGEHHALMFAMLRLGLRWRELSRAENHMIFPGQIDGDLAAPPCNDARLVQYGRSLNPQHRPRFLARLRWERPEHHAWLAVHGPLLDHRAPAVPYGRTRSPQWPPRAVDAWEPRRPRSIESDAARRRSEPKPS